MQLRHRARRGLITGATGGRGTTSVAPPEVYGWARIWAGSWFLSDLDPFWWREGGFVPASLAALDMADPYRCMLAWWAARYLPDPPRQGPRRAPRQVPPYDRAVRALRLEPPEAEALGFTGVDADVLTAGWRHLIARLRASHDHLAAVDPEQDRHQGGETVVEMASVELSEPSMAAGLRLAARLRAAYAYQVAGTARD